MAEPENEPEASAPDEVQPADVPDAPAPSPPADGASTDETDPDLDPTDDEAQSAAAAWISVAGDAIFQGSPGDARHRRRRPGRLDEVEVAAAIRGFVEPPGLTDALVDLRTQGLVVLAGAEGTGRRCAATWLLAQVSSGELVVLSPGDTIDQLARRTFVRGRGYLVADFAGERGLVAIHRHDTHVLRRQLLDCGAHLVITTSTATGQRHFADLTRAWQPVPGEVIAADVLDRHEGLLEPDDRARLLAACRNLSPAPARAVLERLLADGLHAALDRAQELGHSAVTAWFDADPGEADVVRIATAAFVPYCAKRTYEAHHATLRRLRQRWFGEGDAPPEPLRQEHRELRAIELLQTEAAPFGAESPRPRVLPRSPEIHAAIVAEVHDRYGDDLLQPLHQLQHEASGSEDLVTRLGVARGIALLARVAPDDASVMLRTWADGPALQRRTAAYALSWMCDDDATGALALQLAISWCSGAGTRRAVTAALAFGLELSVRYPVPSVSHLWNLALRSSLIAVYAGQALAALVRTTASERDGVDEVLRVVDKQMRNLLDVRPARFERVRRGTEVIRDLLCATAPDGQGTVTEYLLRTHPDLAGRLGLLWAEVLCSRPHRHRAVLDLRKDLNRLEPDVDHAAVAAMGAAIRSRLAAEQWEWLRRDLPGGEWLW